MTSNKYVFFEAWKDSYDERKNNHVLIIFPTYSSEKPIFEVLRLETCLNDENIVICYVASVRFLIMSWLTRLTSIQGSVGLNLARGIKLPIFSDEYRLGRLKHICSFLQKSK